MPQLEKLFNYNPPSDQKDIDGLFCNRQDELEFGLDLLHAGIKLNNIYVIYGNSRMGKSHFMKKLINELKTKKRPFYFCNVNANSKQKARYVLENIFKQLKNSIFSYYSDTVIKSNTTDEKMREHINLLETISPLVTGEQQKVTFSFKKEYINKHEQGFKIFQDFIQIIWHREIELQDAESVEWEATTVTDDHLINLIKYESDVIIKLTDKNNLEYKSILLAVDDLDLLYEKSENEVISLVNLLNNLASESPFNILATVRKEAFGEKIKDMITLVEIKSIDDEDIKEIYEKHLKLFNDNKPVFTTEAYDYLVKCSEGCIGNFLGICCDLFKGLYGRYKRNEKIEKKDIKEKFEKNVKELLKSNLTKEIMLEIINCVQKEQKFKYNTTKSIPHEFFSEQILIKNTKQIQSFYINKLFYDVILEMSLNT